MIKTPHTNVRLGDKKVSLAFSRIMAVALPHASAMPYFRLTNALNDPECLTERHMLKLIKAMRDCYDELDMEFMAMTDLLADYMISKNPFIFKVQRFIRHCDRYSICIPYLLDDTPKKYRKWIENEGRPLDERDYENLSHM